MDLSGATAADLRRELQKRDRANHALLRKWQRCLRKLEDVEAEMTARGMSPPKRTGEDGHRPGDSGLTLRDLLWELMGKDKVWGPASLTEKALANGWSTTSRSPRGVVNQCLISQEGAYFERVSPGKYRRLEDG